MLTAFSSRSNFWKGNRNSLADKIEKAGRVSTAGRDIIPTMQGSKSASGSVNHTQTNFYQTNMRLKNLQNLNRIKAIQSIPGKHRYAIEQRMPNRPFLDGPIEANHKFREMLTQPSP